MIAKLQVRRHYRTLALEQDHIHCDHVALDPAGLDMQDASAGQIKGEHAANRSLLFLMAHQMIGGVAEQRMEPRAHRCQACVDSLMRIRGDHGIDPNADLLRIVGRSTGPDATSGRDSQSYRDR